MSFYLAEPMVCLIQLQLSGSLVRGVERIEETMSNSTSSSLAKIAALIGGATVGVLIANWLDEQLLSRARKRSDYDRTRYEQGLGPIAITPRATESSAAREMSDDSYE
jgi:hypothetical protein